MTLLEQAKRVRHGNRAEFPQQEIELAIACFTGQVSQTQVCKTMNLPSGSATSWLYYRLLEAWRQGLVVVKEKGK